MAVKSTSDLNIWCYGDVVTEYKIKNHQDARKSLENTRGQVYKLDRLKRLTQWYLITHLLSLTLFIYLVTFTNPWLMLNSNIYIVALALF